MSDDIEARAAEAVAHGLLKAALADDRTARLRVTTGSMQPAIRAGDEILLKACAWTDLRPGDVVVCERDGILQVHRFLRIKVVDGGPRLVTKGDAAWHFDSPLPVDRLIGRAERIERDGQGIDLMGGWPRALARWIAAASAMKAYGAQVFRQLKHRAALAVVLSLALSLHYLTSASAAVSVSSFDAQGGQGQITLNWITATELKNFGFNVERSVNSADPNAWTKIAFVQSQSPCIQSLEPLTYTYMDGGLPAGAKYYYRLQLFGSPCGDPNVYHDTIVSAVASGAVATATPTATAVPPTATPSPTATATPAPTVTPPATSTTSPSAPNATGVPATNTPASVPPGGPGATVSAPSAPVPSASARAAPAVTIAAAPSSGAAVGTPVPPDAPATVEPTTTVVAMVVATTAPNAPRTNPQAPRKPTPTEPAVAASPSPTLLGVGVLAVLGMGMAGFGLLAVAGFVLWQYYLHR